jgi:hypothetical protein
MRIGDKRWRAHYLGAPQTGCFSLLHPPSALGSKLARGNPIYHGRKNLDDALRESAILSFKVDAPVSHARCRYAQHFRWRGRRTKPPHLRRKRLGVGQVRDLGAFRRSPDYAKHKRGIVVFHGTRTLNCHVRIPSAVRMPNITGWGFVGGQFCPGSGFPPALAAFTPRATDRRKAARDRLAGHHALPRCSPGG